MPWVCSFLDKRSQCVRYKNELSEFQVLQGGVPQGTKFGPLCFLAQINDALQEPQQGISILKYVDDVSIVENGFANKDGNMQSILDDFSDWSVCNNMKLNPDKCAVMNVCFMKNPIRPPPLEICLQQLQMVDCVKILGVQISHDLKWNNHVSELVHKAHGKQYMLKMLKKFNLSTADLLTIYKGYVRSLLEYAVPVWNAGLTAKQVYDLERVQKRALRIILGATYTTYQEALDKTNLCTLQQRKKGICLKFATELGKSISFKDWLPKQRGYRVQYNLRDSNKISRVRCKTNRHKNSPIPYFIDLLNEK